MSQEELADFAQALMNMKNSEKKFRAESYLTTAHELQINFHKAHNRVRLLFGGNRSGKTTAGTMEFYWLLSGTHPFIKCRTPIKAVLICQDFQNHAKDVIMPKIIEWFPEGFIVNMEKNQVGIVVKITGKNGSTVDIRSHDQDIKIFESSDYDLAWFDEPPPEKLFKAVWRGLTDRGGRAYITGTPITEPWVHDLYMMAQAEDNKGIYWSQFMATDDNATNLGEGDAELGRKRIEEFISVFDADEREARRKGRFLHMQGLVFKTWDRKTHLVDNFPWPHHWPVWFSLDPHPRKPWAISLVGHTPSGNRILIKSAYVEGVVEDIANAMFDLRGGLELDKEGTKPRIARVVIDNYASVESMIKRTTIIDELNSYIYPTMPKAQTAPKNVDQKIDIFKNWLKPIETNYGPTPTFLVFRDGNDDFIYEIEHYVWEKYTGARKSGYKDKPEKKNDDILDTIMQVALILGSTNSDSQFTKREPIKYAGRQ